MMMQLPDKRIVTDHQQYIPLPALLNDILHLIFLLLLRNMSLQSSAKADRRGSEEDSAEEEQDHPKVKLKECEDCLTAEALKSLNGHKNAPRLHVFNHRHCNGGVPLLRGERILKDTEVHLTHKDVSPQYSLRSQDSLPPDLGSLASVSIYPSRHNSVSSTCTVPDPGLPVTLEEEEPAPVPIGPMPPDCKNDKCEITEKVRLGLCLLISSKVRCNERVAFA
ncbi:voltage-dependent T-type calcium channel subunit alpha-1H [Trichonephila clavipes]|nr:voltage-dependent T-type calcium channel subunit alpha-1H [Trichonephila clavipes]